jgi:hypothetical protein
MKEMTDEIAFAIWRRVFDQLRFDCLAATPAASSTGRCVRFPVRQSCPTT